MAVAVNGSVNIQSGGVGTMSLPGGVLVAAGSNRMLLVIVEVFSSGSCTGVSSDLGGAFTLIARATGNTSGNSTREISMWQLLAPSTATHTVTATSATNTVAGWVAVQLTGVHQTSPTGTAVTDSGSAAAASVTTGGAVSGDLAVGAMVARTTSTVTYTGSGSELFSTLFSGTNAPMLGATAAGGGSVTTSWTWTGADNFGAIVVPVKDVSGAGGGGGSSLVQSVGILQNA